MADTTIGTDSRDIPVIDAALIPNHTDGTIDWRETADRIREEHRFFRVGDDPVIWFTRFDDARELYENWELFSNRKEYDFPFLIPLDLDPPQSIAYRRMLMPHFSIAYVNTWVPRMRELARDLIESFVDRCEADFISEFAQKHFPGIAAEWMGVPEQDRGKLIEWQHGVFYIPADEMVGTGVQMGNDAMVAMCEYLAGLIESKREHPDDSFISFVANVEDEGVTLTDRERLAIVNMMAIGAAHTTSAHIGYVWHYLAEHPDARRLVREQRDVIDTVCEEIHRIFPLYGIPRTVTRDTEFAGCPLRKGDKVFSLYTQPNRDPRQPGFDHEDLLRRSNPHLGFQPGVHRCLGIHWAKVARRVAIEEWHAAIPDYRIKPDVTLIEQIHSGVGYHSLPLVWNA